MANVTITFPAKPENRVSPEGKAIYAQTSDPGFTARGAFNMLANSLLLSGVRPDDPSDPAQWTVLGDLVNKLRVLCEGGPPGGFGGNSTLDSSGGTLTVTPTQLAVLQTAWLGWMTSATVAQAAEVSWMNTALGLTTVKKV